MATVTVNITKADEWFVSEDKLLTFTVRNSAGAVVNITGWTLEYVLRLAPSHPTKKLTKTTGTGITITDAVNGVLQVDVDSADTDHLRAGTYWHGLARTNAGAYDIVLDGTAVLRRSAASLQSAV
jgi:hypothetical protein